MAEKPTYLVLAGNHELYTRWCSNWHLSFFSMLYATDGYIDIYLRKELERTENLSLILFDSWSMIREGQREGQQEDDKWLFEKAISIHHIEDESPIVAHGEIIGWKKKYSKTIRKPEKDDVFSTRLSPEEQKKLRGVMGFLSRIGMASSVASALRYALKQVVVP